MIKKYILSMYDKTLLNAGPKAKIDVEKILKENYDFYIKNYKEYESNVIKRMFLKMEKILFANIKCRKSDIVVVQTPFSNKRAYMHPIKNKIIFIHDIQGLRNCDNNILKQEIELYKDSKVIISHNSTMTNFLIENGISKDKIVNLKLFDYICDGEIVRKKYEMSQFSTLIFIGNLDKSPFLYEIESGKMSFYLNVYGVLSKEINNEKVFYKGKYLPEEIPSKIEGCLGIIWDGGIDTKNKDMLREYTRYNNPHKLSCYIAAGIPVIAWRESAIAKFITENDIGYLIDDIYDINHLDLSDYDKKVENVSKIANKVRNGEYTKEALNKAFKILEGKY